MIEGERAENFLFYVSMYSVCTWYLCMLAVVCTEVSVCVCLCVYIENQRWHGFFFNSCPLYTLSKGKLLTWSSPFWSTWQSACSRDYLSIMCWDYRGCCAHLAFMRFLEIQLRPSYLWGRNSTNWGFLPAPLNCLQID